MSHALHRLGSAAARRPWRMIGCWLVLSLVVIAASSAFGRDLEDTFEVPGADSHRAVELLSAAGSDQAGLTAQVVVTPTDPTATFVGSPDEVDSLAQVSDRLASLPHVISVDDEATSPDGRVALLRIQYPVLESLGVSDLDALTAAVEDLDADPAVQVEAGGDLFFAFGGPDPGAGELAGLLVAVVVLLVAFGSLIAMGLPIGLALFGLALGVTSMSLVTYVIEIPSFAPQIAAMVGLGVGIDYALLLVTRQREHLTAGLDVAEATGRTVATAGQAVVFAGGTVVIAILGLAVAGIPFVTAGGVAVSVVVLIMVSASISLLPALLGLAGQRIATVGFGRTHRHSRPAVGPRWQRWGTHVGAHAAVYAVGIAALLLALAAPVLALRLGVPDDGSLPETRTERRAYDLVADGFGPGANGPLVIAIDTSRDAGITEPLAAAVAADPGVASVAPPTVNAEAGVATLVALPTTSPQDDRTSDTVDRLRTEVIPTALASSDATAHVGGQTATFADLGARGQERLPWFVVAVVLLSFLLLTLVFRSVVVALKAAVLNLLSIGAAYGVLVMVFQWGWGASLIGLESTVPIMSFIPLFMFAIVFGLSMDYEVFLLSRVREEYRRTGDNDAAVINALATTGRVITSAALIMISVFLGFVFGSDPTTKMLGLGLATAILVDATIVRMILVPATMKLMGKANWWLPAWLDRVLPTIDIDGHYEGRPSAEPETIPAHAGSATS